MRLLYPDLQRGLVGAWCPSRDNSRSTLLTDFSPYRNHGVLANMDPSVAWEPSDGKIALSFDGVDDYTNTGYSRALTGIRAFTVSAWINQTAIADNKGIVCNWLYPTEGNFALQTGQVEGSNNIKVFIATSLTDDGGGYNVETSSNPLTALKWTHVAFTFIGSIGVKIYINSNEQPITTIGSPPAITTSPIGFANLEIGRFSGLARHYNGLIDDVRIYNRTLSQSEIATLAQRRGIAYETKRTTVVRGATTSPIVYRQSRLLCPDLQHGLIGAWCPSRDNSTSVMVTDHSPLRSHGTMGGMVAAYSRTPSEDGDRGVVFNFDGASENSVATYPKITNHPYDFTIAFWVRPRNQLRVITSLVDFSHSNPDGTVYGSWVVQSEDATTNKYYYCSINQGNSTTPIFENSGAGVGVQIADDVWQHIAYTKSGTTIIGYRNGQPVWTPPAMTSGGGVNYIAGSELRIADSLAGSVSSGLRNYNGLMDDILFYGRALTPQEVKTVALRRGIAFDTKQITYFFTPETFKSYFIQIQEHLEMLKNVASQKIGAQLVSATNGSAFTGAVTVFVCGDAGTQATGSVGSGACTHEGNGYHTYAPDQAETNYDIIAFTFTGTGAIPVTIQVRTWPTAGLATPTNITSATGITVSTIAANAITASALATDAVTEITTAAHVGTVITGTSTSTGSTTTNVPIKTLSISLSVTDQIKGRVILFKTDTITAALRGQGAPIDGSTTTAITIAGGNAFTTAPAEDDSFTII